VARELLGVVEHENNLQHTSRRGTLGVLECESGQRAVPREVLGVVEHLNDLQHTRHETPGVLEWE
jgi:hypothetical protein